MCTAGKGSYSSGFPLKGATATSDSTAAPVNLPSFSSKVTFQVRESDSFKIEHIIDGSAAVQVEGGFNFKWVDSSPPYSAFDRTENIFSSHALATPASTTINRSEEENEKQVLQGGGPSKECKLTVDEHLDRDMWIALLINVKGRCFSNPAWKILITKYLKKYRPDCNFFFKRHTVNKLETLRGNNKVVSFHPQGIQSALLQ